MKRILVLLFILSVFCSHAQIKVDYRPYQSLVKNQQNRGTCTAFSICSAMETFPGFPSDLSEQYIYALAKMKYYKEMPKYSEGGLLKYYINILQTNGTVSEEKEPYDPNAVYWQDGEDAFEKMKKDISVSLYNTLSLQDFAYKLEPKMYQYRTDDEAREVEWIKAKLDAGTRAISVCYEVRDSYWFQHTGSRSNKIAAEEFLVFDDKGVELSYAKALEKYPDVASRFRKGLIDAYYVDTSYRINNGHAVAIVGYDESGFLIKNSWGIDSWGDKGYGWVSFEYHKIYATEILSLNLGAVSVLGEPVNEANWKKDEIYMKTLPHDYLFGERQEKGIDISFVYHGSGIMPGMREVEINAYDDAGKYIDKWYGSCQGIFDGRATGYGTHILSSVATCYPTAAKLIVNFTTESGQKFTNTYSKITAQNQELRPASIYEELMLGK
jgi:hypothetical protein